MNCHAFNSALNAWCDSHRFIYREELFVLFQGGCVVSSSTAFPIISLGKGEFSYLMMLIDDYSILYFPYTQQKIKCGFEKVFIFLPLKTIPPNSKLHVNMFAF